MIVTLTSPTSGRRWKITPLANGLCYQIFKEQTKEIGSKLKSGKVIKNAWVDTGRYPSTLDHAIAMTVDLMLKDPDDQVEFAFEVRDKKSLNKSAKDILKGFIDGIEVTIRKKRKDAKS